MELKSKENNNKTKSNYWFLVIINLVFIIILAYPTSVYATDIFTKAGDMMKKVYDSIVKISTISAVVSASVALIVMFFSKNGRAVDESRQWLKRIVLVWLAINMLGFIVTYLTPLIEGGAYSGK